MLIDNLINIRFFYFILSGCFNTAVTYFLYLYLEGFFHYQVAYAISYIFGIFIAYILNLRLVFKSKSSWRKFVRYPFVYLIQYILSALFLYLLISVFRFSHQLSPLIVIVGLLPVSYLMNKKILK